MNLPSASNTSGSLLGALAGAAVVSALPAQPLVIAAAAALGMTPVGLAGIAAIGATALANYLVTHFAEVKGLNDKVSSWWPLITTAAAIKIEDSYPGDKETPPAVTTNLTDSSGNPVT